MTVPAVSAAAAHGLAARGEVSLLDVRTPAAFAEGHPKDALSVPFSARGLGVRARAVLPAAPSSVVLVAPDGPSADTAAAQLTAAGVAVHGAVAGGFDGWRAAGLPVATIGEVAIAALARVAEDATIIDVREPMEWTTGHVPGALLIPLGQLRTAIPSIPRDRRVIAICEAGVRSCTAASVLAAAGFSSVAHVPAGSSGYRAAGLPLAFAPAEVAGR